MRCIMEIGINASKKISMNPKMINRHGLITGATGTGKTVTLKVLAEAFSEHGIPVFMQDVKGDLTGFIEPGAQSDKFQQRLLQIGLESVPFTAYPATFWDIFGEEGHPIRATVSDMGPLMLSKLLTLNDVQTSVLFTIFKFADENGLLLLDFKDLVAVLSYITDNSSKLEGPYKSISKATLGAIHRKLIIMEQEGIEHFFGEPAFDIHDLLTFDNTGRGMIHVLESSKLSTNPSLYSTFLLWLLSELFEDLDEVGDLDKPRLVFFFDEAHLIFKDMSKSLLDKFEQIVKLIRSKGVGIYFITQNPLDIPESVLAQLGNRIQHALRAYTPKEQKAVRVAADTFRQNEAFDTADVISNLGVGEALISFLDDQGIPSIVERAYIMPPKSKIGPVAEQEAIIKHINMSFFKNKYSQSYDRHSAYEALREKALHTQNASSTKEEVKKSIRKTDSPLDRFMKSTASSIGSHVGRSLIRGILGSLKK
ncbi:MAG: ATP-binding protein [Firmicutes bacterium HGW-Firmicutes-3]|nr:MAG: ATP-binding protein [Firmicutes bacterium HGW-Firmicutes-3]